jgi:ketosteroid isomerase-like protein
MSAEENKKFVQGIFEQMAAGNGRALSDAMADDFRWVVPGDGAWSGTWESKASALHEMLLPLMAQFDGDYRSEVDLILADEDRVVVQSRGYATTKRGEPYHQTYCYIFRVAGDRLTEVVEYCDTALVERVLEAPIR